jgi:hypothetical protein
VTSGERSFDAWFEQRDERLDAKDNLKRGVSAWETLDAGGDEGAPDRSTVYNRRCIGTVAAEVIRGRFRKAAPGGPGDFYMNRRLTENDGRRS